MNKFLFTAVFIAFSVFYSNAQILKQGTQAPSFSLKGVDGRTVSLSDYNNRKGVILIFTCNTCPCAESYEDRVINLHRMFAPKGFPVVAINPNDPIISKGDSFDAMKKRAKDKSYPFPYLVDAKQDVASKYGATRTPEVFLLKKVSGGFEVAYTGAIDNNYDEDAATEKYVQKAIDAVIKNKTPSPAATRAVGCGIKVKK